MGKVCSSQHVPCFLEKADELKAAGLDRIMCIAVDTPEAVEKWASSVKLSGSKIEVWADTKGYWTRMLGLDIEQPDAQGPKSQRYAALVENGILLKLMVEPKLGTVSESTADVLLACIKKLEALKSQNKDPVGKI
jgi:peroxiredoxin